jgi:hypothetical protein
MEGTLKTSSFQILSTEDIKLIQKPWYKILSMAEAARDRRNFSLLSTCFSALKVMECEFLYSSFLKKYDALDWRLNTVLMFSNLIRNVYGT